MNDADRILLNESIIDVLNDNKISLSKLHNEDFDKIDREVLEVIKHSKYIEKKEIWMINKDETSKVEMHSGYSFGGGYIGDMKDVAYLVDKRGITPELSNKKNTTCSIGFNEKENKWYGWSHRAICGFGLGNKIFDGKYGDGKALFTQHGDKEITNLEEARQAAVNFAAFMS